MLRLLFGILLLLVSSGLSAQNIESILERMDAFWNYNPQEKIYVHTDRSVYTAGETLWFKTYNTIGIDNNLSILSNINYIELIDPRDNIVQDQIIAINTGVGDGNITLADTLVEGTYRLRAYTNWMRNYAPDYFFEKKITITNGRTDNVLTTSSLIDEASASYYTVTLRTLSGTPLGKTTVRYQFVENGNVVDRGSERTDESGLLKIRVNNKNKGRSLVLSFTNIDKRNVSKVVHTNIFESENSLQVFPEGGHLLAGYLNKIAVKALKPNGMGIKAVVDVLDEQDSKVGSVETNDLGMGVISFFPNPNEQYSLKVKFDDGTEQVVDISEIKTSGMSLIVNNQNTSRLYAQINASEDMLSESELFFVVHHLGKVYYVSKQKMDKTNMVFSVPKDRLPTGVITVSILNESLVPIFERPVFNEDPSRSLPLTATLNKATFSTREKVETHLTVGDTQDTMKIASLSAAVVNMDKLSDTANLQTNIYSALLLEADLKGYIESPGYYFNEDGSANVVELDYLMLTQGWRKINWDELSMTDIPKKFEAEKSLSIKGYTRKLGRKAAAPNSAVQLISTDNLMNFLDTMATEDGYFVFDNLLFTDSTQFLISAKDEKGRNNIDIVVEEELAPDIGALQGGMNDLNSLYSKAVTESKRFFSELERKGLMANTIDIEEVVVTRQAKKVPDHSRNMNGPGNADQVLTEEDMELCSTLEMCLNGRLMGVVFKNGAPYNTRGMVPMQLMVDGMAMEGEMLSTIAVMDVASVEVLRNINYTSIYGPHGANGVIVITTKLGVSRSSNYTPKGLLSLQPKGISIPIEFYKPVYEVDSEYTFANDLRTTIHWEPMIVTDKEGKTSFDFYTSDEPGTYRMVIEGIDLYGRVGRKIVDVEVKK